MSEQELGAVEEQSATTEDLSGSENTQVLEASEGESTSQKMLSQDHVNKLIGLTRKQERERFEAERKREAELQTSPKYAEDSTGKDPLTQLMEQIDARTKAAAKAAAREELQSDLLQREDAVISRDFRHKIETALVDDPELVDIIQDLDLKPESSGIDAQIIRMTTPLENTAAVLKELGKHPEKFSSVIGFLRDGRTKMAENALKSISAGIARNEAARKSTPAPKPPGKLEPSNLGIGGGKITTLDQMKGFFN